MNLKLGLMKTNEIAEWFGIKPKTFRNQKKERLEILKDYCSFEEVYGGVNILEIYDKIDSGYVKDKSKNYTIIREAFDEEWSDSGLDTCSNVKVKIYNKHKEELTIAESTAYNYTIKARNELYGKPFVSLGDLGSCSYIWCKKETLEDGLVILTEFTDKEQEIKRQLMKKYFGSDEEKEILIHQMVKEGEITKEEAYDLLCEMKNFNKQGFMAFKLALEEAIGCSVIRGTKIEKRALAESFNWD